VRWASRKPARYWWAGLYNQMLYRTADEVDARYDAILTGNHTSESGCSDEASAATASVAL
jgi:hypothetical protein